MRNIKFDESTVLAEFLKICADRDLLGLKKEAQTAPAPKEESLPGPEEVAPGRETMEFENQLRGFPISYQLFKTGNLVGSTVAGDLVKEMLSDPFKRFIFGMSKSPSKENVQGASKLKQLILGFLSKLKVPAQWQQIVESAKAIVASESPKNIKVAEENPVTKAIEYLNEYWAKIIQEMPEDKARALFNKSVQKLAANLKTKYGARFDERSFLSAASQLISRGSNRGSLISKSAKESRLYDISGETGKDLVDKAHPGGGTRTELTHSKTDENLVETIVEQQEKDIEVVRKVPKGVYAALTNLADGLDKLGYKKQADFVDRIILKTALETESAAQFKIDLLSAIDSLPASRFQTAGKERLIKEIKQISPSSMTEVMHVSKKKVDKWSKMFPQAPGLFSAVAKRWQPALAYEREMLERDRSPVEEGLAGEKEPELVPLVSVDPELAPIPTAPAQQKTLNWQKYYNHAIKGTALPRLKEDGLMGPATRAALKRVRDTGAKTLAEFRNAITQPKEYVGKSVLPSAPEPPPAPKDPIGLGEYGARERVYRRRLITEVNKAFGQQASGHAMVLYDKLINQNVPPEQAYRQVISRGDLSKTMAPLYAPSGAKMSPGV